MNQEDVVNEHGIELAIGEIALIISQKIDEFKITRDKKIEQELSELIDDRNKIYNNDKETIKKYLNMRRK